ADVELRDLRPPPPAHVGDLEGDGGARLARDRLGRDRQCAVLEARVREAVSEGEERLLPRLVEVAVAEEDPCLVNDLFGGARVIAGGDGAVGKTAFEGDRQLPRRRYLAEQRLGERRPALLARVPGFDDGGDVVDESGHVDAAA